MRIGALPALATLSLICSSADARIITVEPDDYIAGQSLSTAGEGARLYTFTNIDDGFSGIPPALSEVYAQRNPICSADPLRCDAFSGTQGFGHTPDADSALYGDWFDFSAAASCWRWTNVGGPGNPCGGSNPFRALLITFDRPTDFIELSGAYLSDPPSLYAFDSEFNLVGLCAYSDGPNCSSVNLLRPTHQYNVKTVAITTEAPMVTYLLAGGVSGNSSLDGLRYNVPEPGTLALLGVGLLGCALGRRRLGARSYR